MSNGNQTDTTKLGCDYQGSHFGANYEDATCIEGFLWDLDSCDEPGGGLSVGGDIPCPQCNKAAHDEWVREDREGRCGD